MAHKLKLVRKSTRGVLITSAVVGLSAIVGSFIPLAPFVFLPVSQGIWGALLISALALFGIGLYKAKLTIGSLWKSGLEIAAIGVIAALVGYGVGTLFKV